MPDILAQLTLHGVKTATASAYPAYLAENAPLPQAGLLNVVLDAKGEAVCIIKDTKVSTVPFCDVSAEHAYKEGEGDRSLRAWRDCHRKVFTMELNELDKTFDENMLVVCEEFKVVYPLK